MDNVENKNEKDVTELVNNCFLRIEDIEKKIANSELSAKSAKESADKAMSVERHFFQNTTAKIVDQLQPAVKDLANAIEVSAETQKLLFEHQTILAECCRSLFGMGVSNITMIRCTINTIKMKLENASDEEISEMAKQELLNVVRQLKMQDPCLWLFSSMREDMTWLRSEDSNTTVSSDSTTDSLTLSLQRTSSILTQARSSLKKTARSPAAWLWSSKMQVLSQYMYTARMKVMRV